MLILERVLKRGKNIEIGPLESYGRNTSTDTKMSFRFRKTFGPMTCDVVCDNDGALKLVSAIAGQAVAFHTGVFANYGKAAEQLRKREAAKWLLRLAQQLIDESNAGNLCSVGITEMVSNNVAY